MTLRACTRLPNRDLKLNTQSRVPSLRRTSYEVNANEQNLLFSIILTFTQAPEVRSQNT